MNLKKYAYPMLLALNFLIGCCFCAQAQVEGLWLVKKVTVANEVKTPVAKWVHLKPDGTHASGNGLLQHIAGSWYLDSKKSFLTIKDSNGPDESFGPFQISVKKNEMTWQRTEDGERVLVELERTSSLPEGPADKIIGLWDVEKVIKNEADITSAYDARNKEYIFIRWDRVFVKRSSTEERQTGIWHINGHYPILTLLNNPAVENQQWEISFEESKMTWVGVSENNKSLKIIYQRINEFPR